MLYLLFMIPIIIKNYTNFLGIPKEPIGMSNDATGFMGAPKYKDAKFKVTKDTAITITVK